jgi:UDP-N-acetyl-D-glucosamine dehydrogenase
MTPQFLLETSVEDRPDTLTPAWPVQEQPFQAVTGNMRITREAGAGKALVAVVGLGHVGLPSAVALRRAGFRVLGIDTSSSRLSEIRGGLAELSPGDAEELRGQLRDDGFVLSGELDALTDAELVLICAPTTVDAQGRPNCEALKRACAAVVRHARAGQTLVLTSSTYVGSTRELLVEPLAERGLCVGEDVFVAFSPDRIVPGSSEREQLSTPRVVGAVTETCFAHAAELLRPLSDTLHRVSSPAAAEMVRLYESTFRAVNIALAFELADVCRTHALDPIEVTDAAASKPFGFMAHYPSAGAGGHAVGVDPQFLLHPLRDRGGSAPLAETAMRTLAARPQRVATRAHQLLLRSGRQLRDVRVLVVGAGYKPGVADCANSPAAEIVSRLQDEGIHVDFHDPLVRTLRVDGEDIHGIDPDPRRDASGFGPEDYDLAILVTIQPGCDYGWLRRCPEVLDGTYRQRTGRRHFLL